MEEASVSRRGANFIAEMVGISNYREGAFGDTDRGPIEEVYRAWVLDEKE